MYNSRQEKILEITNRKGSTMMSLKLQFSNRVWTVFKGKGPVAEIHLDYSHQVDDVVLYADSSAATQLQVLRLAASHAAQFVKNRTVPAMGGLMVAEHRNHNLNAADSWNMMNFELIPEAIQKLDRDSIVEELRPLRVDVIVAIHKTAQEAIDDSLSQVGVTGLKYSVIPQRMLFDNEVALQFTVKKPHHFTFWKSESVPTGQGWDLHVVPSYHPVMNGWKAAAMLNGDTDTYIRGNAVRNVYCPKVAQSNPHGRTFGSSWGRVKHPFYATGRSMSIRLNTTKMRSKEGVEELAGLLRAALGLNKEYIEVSGGFNAPLKCAHNRLLEINRRSPYPKANNSRNGHVARGSEQHCVWAYRTLKDEGVLEKSHVPSWFIEEGWLEIYEGAEVGPTLF